MNQSPCRRLLVVIRWPVGGIRTYLLYNYPALLEAGYRFTIVGPDDDSLAALQRDAGHWPGVEFVGAPVMGQKCYLRSAVRPLLRSGRFAMIHSQGLTAGVSAVLANIGIGVPHVITSHDVVRAAQFPGMVGWLKRWLLARLLRQADALVPVSHDAAENHARMLPGLQRGRCRLVPIVNGIDVRRFAEAPPRATPGLRAQIGLEDDVLLLGFLGRFMEQKGFLVLVEALDRLLADRAAPRVHVAAVGSGDMLAEYRREVERRPRVSAALSFVDFTPDPLPLLVQFDWLVMPSLWEACPLLAMEALCAGIPILGTDALGLREVLRGTPALVVPLGQPEPLAAAIRQAAAAPHAAAARRYAPEAVQRFDVSRSAAALVRLMEDVLAGRQRTDRGSSPAAKE